jgi:pSer/pThr/pTyr-binding forkhead associated (FHA) protein
VLGRAPGNDYCLPSSTISKTHAVFLKTPEGWTITDLGSSNGTLVDGRRLSPQKPEILADNALISLGSETQAKFFTPMALFGFLKLFLSGML